ncbi:hypothetical protein HPB52_013037 [Rhipicephalus sanguineus]|uniref:Uncharacterized protein n=1 Tax=Rhipicephalus sanguineus TaxID=34632 RepID=A0A9D4PE39_RHISA|nr:hypothetical protein HPB52_013037 [Rhipicephalus sanguineus]
MHPQLQDLVEGKQFANLAELAKAADGLMERYWRRFQYKPPPPPTDQVARDLAFQPSVNVAGLSGARPGVTMAAAAAPLQHPSAASYWPLHPAAIQPSYHRDQLHRLCVVDGRGTRWRECRVSSEGARGNTGGGR